MLFSTWTKSLLSSVLCAMCLLMSEAMAASAQEQLQGFISKVQAATGSFSQFTVGTQGQTKPAQSGQFAFQRPGRFKWDVVKPYAQQIVSDGQQLFQFDPDLNQVTVRKVDQAIGSSPAAILFGSGSLEQSFTVTALPDKEGLSWLRAKPRNGEAGFVHVDLGFSGGLPARIILLDAFGQNTHIELSGLVPNPKVAAEAFRFVPPPGADVVRMQ
jgi:outer membrane lipoprotein carrier protein